jgi:hypothetical protein
MAASLLGVWVIIVLLIANDDPSSPFFCLDTKETEDHELHRTNAQTYATKPANFIPVKPFLRQCITDTIPQKKLYLERN